MAETPSTMIPLGTRAPDFKLLDSCSNKQLSLQELKSEVATVIMFLCNHCPYVKYIQKKLVAIVKQYQATGVSFIAISSNDAEKYPQDGIEAMRKEAALNGYTFPFLYDETQDIAHAYHAACTPDFYIFDKKLECVYRGRFDNATPGNKKLVSGADLTQALDNILANKPIPEKQFPSLGCNIKWKK